LVPRTNSTEIAQVRRTTRGHITRLPLQVRVIYALFKKVLKTQGKLAPLAENIEGTETFDTTVDVKHINVHDSL